MGAQTTYPSQPAIGHAGTMFKRDPEAFLGAKNVEASAPMAAGKQAVCFKTSAATSDFDVLLPAAQSDKVMGIPVKEDTFDRTWTDADGVTHGQLGPNGYVAGTLFNAARFGRMLCVAAKACKPGDPLFVRAVAGGGEYLGALENASDSSDMIDCTGKAEWVTTAANAGDLAWLEFDFRN